MPNMMHSGSQLLPRRKLQAKSTDDPEKKTGDSYQGVLFPLPRKMPSAVLVAGSSTQAGLLIAVLHDFF